MEQPKDVVKKVAVKNASFALLRERGKKGKRPCGYGERRWEFFRAQMKILPVCFLKERQLHRREKKSRFEGGKKFFYARTMISCSITSSRGERKEKKR